MKCFVYADSDWPLHFLTWCGETSREIDLGLEKEPVKLSIEAHTQKEKRLSILRVELCF